MAALALSLACAQCRNSSECDSPPVVPAVALPGGFEVVDHYLGGRDAVTIVGDCNGDGRIDIVNGAMLHVQRPDGTFTPTPIEDALGRKAGSMIDLDGDGATDLVLAGAAVEWRRGDGLCHFEAPRQIAGPVEGEAAQVLAYDVDRDGLTDLTVARQERFDLAFQLLIARGDGRFEDHTPAPTPPPGHRDGAYRTFGTFYDDVDRDGAPDLFAIEDNDLGWFSWGIAGDPPRFQQDPDVTESFSAVSPMSVSPIDYDRDGVFEYFVSGVFGNHLLYRYAGGRELENVASRAAVCAVDSSDDGWGSVSFDVDLDGYPDLLFREEPDDHHDGGWVRLLVNRRDGTFGTAVPAVLRAKLQGTSLACADFNADGHVSCLARDFGSRGLVFLRNRVVPAGGWVGLRLRGTLSSPDASGARVSLDGVAPPLVVMAGAQSPTLGEHDRSVLLAVGAATSAAVTVTWPSGLHQRVSGLAVGRYATVVEPVALTVTTRVAPADGSTRVEVIADPRAAGAATAALSCVGVCGWEGPATTDAEGRQHRMLRAPTAPGSARLGLTLDGVALGVRPRVRFE